MVATLPETRTSVNIPHCNIGPRTTPLRIKMWNVKGQLRIKLNCPDFVADLHNFDVILFQETHLRPEEHECISPPQGFTLYAKSRAGPHDFRRPWGGVLTLVREQFSHRFRRDLSFTDILTVELAGCLIVNAYIIPENGTSWWDFTGKHPLEQLLEMLTAISATTNVPVLVLTDINARTGGQQVHSFASAFPRVSQDDKAPCSRGRRLLRELGSLGYHIVNGCIGTGPRSHLFTSYQPRGRTVIDYALSNRTMTPLLKSLEVGPHNEMRSDHSPIHVTLALEIDTRSSGALPNSSIRNMRHSQHTKRESVELPTETELDRLYVEVVNSATTDNDNGLVTTYGFLPLPTAPIHKAPLCVYCEGALETLGDSIPRGGAGVYRGPNSDHNISVRVPGPHLSLQRTHIYAIWRGLCSVPLDRSIILYSSSREVLTNLTHNAAQNTEYRWMGHNADLYTNIIFQIRSRTCPTHFQFIRAEGGIPASGQTKWCKGNAHLEEARRLALTGATMAVDLHAPSVKPILPITEVREQGRCRVTTDTPKPTAQPRTTTDERGLAGLAAHRNRIKNAQLQQRNLSKFLAAAESSAKFWKVFREFARPQQIDTSLVTAEQLVQVFEPRMNPPEELPSSFNRALHGLNEITVESLPEITKDHTVGQFFDKAFTVEEIEMGKAELQRLHPSKSAAGFDRVHYSDILKMDSELITTLINRCLNERDKPAIWMISVLVAVIKKDKPKEDPNSYRAVALESCTLKFVTLLCLLRMEKWAETTHILPPSQNGFRKKHRTNNNAFILRACIEKARTMGKTLWVASIDITNAFPSVHRATLWLKLRRNGAGGKIFDWLRTIYEAMRYRVRHGQSISEEIKALMGILIGDTASSILWILYFADFSIPVTNDDVELCGAYISHLEQADDLLLIALSPQGLQRKINLFHAWCGDDFLLIHAGKSKVGYHGPRPGTIPAFTIGNNIVEIIGEYTYVGMTFKCGNHAAFHTIASPHYTNKVTQARAIAHGILHVESMIGTLPPNEGRILYMGCVDPHLTFGCEVALDTNSSLAEDLSDVQISFFRRLLGLSRRSITVATYTETGIAPILYRRMELALRYLLYALNRPNDTYVNAAIRESFLLHESGSRSWVTDLVQVLTKLLPKAALPIPSPVELQDTEIVSSLIDRCRKALTHWVEEEQGKVYRKSHLLQHRKEPRANGNGSVYKTRCMRTYLTEIKAARHRKAFTKIICGDHPLAVERLRWTDNNRLDVPYDDRLCRFCHNDVETPTHALLICEHPPLRLLREGFLKQYYDQIGRNRAGTTGESHGLTLLAEIVSFKPLLSVTARYMYEVLKTYEEHPMYILPQYYRRRNT